MAMAGVSDARHLTYAQLYDLAISRDKIRWKAVSVIAAYSSGTGIAPSKINPYSRGEF